MRIRDWSSYVCSSDLVHWGATTQDIMDTGLVLRLREALDILEDRLDVLAGRLATLADAERGTVMLARTRGQQATPTSFGLKETEEHTSELQSLMRISYAVFCLKKKNPTHQTTTNQYKHI